MVVCSIWPHGDARTDISQLFETQPLDPDKNNDEFFSDAKTGVQPIDGKGQMVYWQQCTIRVFSSSNVDKLLTLHSKSDGQGRIDEGVSLLFEEGKVKETA